MMRAEVGGTIDTRATRRKPPARCSTVSIRKAHRRAARRLRKTRLRPGGRSERSRSPARAVRARAATCPLRRQRPHLQSLMRSAMNQLGMSARTFHRVLKLARTIADLGDRTDSSRAPFGCAQGRSGGGDPPSVDRDGKDETQAIRGSRRPAARATPRRTTPPGELSRPTWALVLGSRRQIA